MRSTGHRVAAALAAIGLCLGAGAAHADREWTPEQENEAWQSYLDNVEAALGSFDDIHVYQKTHDRWKLATGKYIPVTVDDATPGDYSDHMAVDRPMLLPPDILAPGTGEGGGVPYSVVGRMPGSNPEVQWVFLSRHYYVSDPERLENTIPAKASHGDACNSFACLNDIAIIGHHPRTGATAFFQFYHTDERVYAPTIRSPWNPDGKANWNTEGKAFWNDVTWVADINCAKCHSADPFIHSPWISQVKVDLQPGQTQPETMVPSNPLGPYFIVGAEVGGKDIFEGAPYQPKDEHGEPATDNEGKPVMVDPGWSQYLKHLADADNLCTTCHRIPQADSDFAQAVQLYARSILGLGIPKPKAGEKADAEPEGYRPDANQTAKYQALPWMPPLDKAYGDFYAGQIDTYCTSDPCQSAKKLGNWEEVGQAIRSAYEEAHGKDAEAVNLLSYGTEAQRNALDAKLRDVPAPPERYRSIVVNRDHRDEIAPNQPVLVVDMRMRANTDTSLATWRFQAASDQADLQATPVVLRRMPSESGGTEFEIFSLGTPRGASSGGDWVPVSELGEVAIAAGAFMGLLLSNGGVNPQPGLVPYSEDDWAAPVSKAGTTFPPEIVTYAVTLERAPKLGDRVPVQPSQSGLRTYSFEFRSPD